VTCRAGKGAKNAQIQAEPLKSGDEMRVFKAVFG
jgi:hypothetical protein